MHTLYGRLLKSKVCILAAFTHLLVLRQRNGAAWIPKPPRNISISVLFASAGIHTVTV
jgi:hypothetical protein